MEAALCYIAKLIHQHHPKYSKFSWTSANLTIARWIKSKRSTYSTLHISITNPTHRDAFITTNFVVFIALKFIWTTGSRALTYNSNILDIGVHLRNTLNGKSKIIINFRGKVPQLCRLSSSDPSPQSSSLSQINARLIQRPLSHRNT